ncbi:cobalamin biosynthesis protein [Teichococcus coralli]|uniref:cobalamin biosynthesis protein n=1 Tax=Teichococcus coralli TaxID=2545983 RepID=UPI003462FE8A
MTQYAVEKPRAGSWVTLSPRRRGPGEATPPLATAGLGLRPSASTAAIVALVRHAESLAGLRVGRLAAPAFRRNLPALPEAALALGVELVFLDHDALLAVQDRCPTRSEAALRATGIASVAEGCALAMGGALVLPRIVEGGVACAISTETIE